MAIPQTYQTSIYPVRMVEPPKNVSGLSQLFAAALVNHQFCKLLIDNPKVALQQGYLGNTFNLTHEEQALITTARAVSLSDLARQVTRVLNQ